MRPFRPARLRPALCGIVLLVASACNADPAGPELPEADLRILFVGNSLTYTNEMPLLLEAMAEAQGRSLATATIAGPDLALEDHWYAGIADDIRALEPDLVVMQQGPSSLAENQRHLIEWSTRISEVVIETGGRPVLLMVWPPLSRIDAFDAVRTAYVNAALEAGGEMIPAGEVIRRLLAVPGGPDPLGPDGFHPSRLGSLAVAATVLRWLDAEGLAGLPASVPPSGRRPGYALSDVELGGIIAAVERVAEA